MHSGLAYSPRRRRKHQGVSSSSDVCGKHENPSTDAIFLPLDAASVSRQVMADTFRGASKQLAQVCIHPAPFRRGGTCQVSARDAVASDWKVALLESGKFISRIDQTAPIVPSSTTEYRHQVTVLSDNILA
jgi:hypothetical protein